MGYFNQVTSGAEFKRFCGRTSPKSLASVLENGQSASTWGVDHIIAFRVLGPRSPSTMLPSISKSKYQQYDVASVPEIQLLIKGVPRDDCLRLSKHQLSRQHPEVLANVFASLGRLLAAESRDPGFASAAGTGTGTVDDADDVDDADAHIGSDVRQTPKPKRQRMTKALASSFVDSSTMTVGSSPSRAPGASQSSHSPHSSVGDSYNSSPPTDAPETLTMSFIKGFIDHALNWVPPQNGPTPFRVLEYDEDQLTYLAPLHHAYEYTAIDDGGLSLRSARVSKGSAKAAYRRHVVMVEAKRRFAEDGDGAVDIPNRTLAQMLGETLARAMSDDEVNQDANGDRRFIVIAAAGYHVRLVEFIYSRSYLEQLRSHLEDANAVFETFARIESTHCMDMSIESDRKAMVRNLSGLVAKFAL